MSVSTENFLKSIYQLKHDFGAKASSSNVASQLNISHAAVTDMAKKLSARGFIIYRKYKEISLTQAGTERALSIIRRHRLWETFLSHVLSLQPDDVHKEAEMLEHQTSDYLLQKIDEYLEFPRFDPHGDPIPDINGNLPLNDAIPLNEAKTGKIYPICRLQHNEDQIQNFFSKNGIKLGLEILVEDILEHDGSVIIKFGNKQIILNSKISQCIHVKSMI